MDAKSEALVALGKALRSRGYRFTAITPASHRLVLARPAGASTLQSIFGWNRPFPREALDEDLLSLLDRAGALEAQDGVAKSAVRFASIGDLLFAHSGFPTAEPDSVFFGPDTYRFVRLIRASLAGLAPQEPLRIVDIGCGSGAGGIAAATMLPGPREIILADISPKALAFAAINAAINDMPVHTRLSDIFQDIEGEADVVIANPPYLVDEDRRLYRHGGGALGISIALKIAEQGLARLKPGGRLILYTGTPILNGSDPLFESLRPLLQLYARQHSYEEVDPDVFGEELGKPAYASADRIAAIGLTAIKRG